MAADGIVGDKTGTDSLNRATMHLGEVFTWASMRMEPRRRDFARRYAQYRGNMNVFGRDTVQTQLRSQIWIPKSGALVETVIPKTIGDNPTIEIRGRKPEFAESAQLMERLLDYYLHSMHFFDVLYAWWKDALVYGTGITKCIWSYKEGEKIIAQPDPLSADTDEDQFEPSAVIEDIPRLVNVDIFDFLFDYTASTIPKMDFVMEKYELPLDVVIGRLQRGFYKGITEDELLSYTAGSRELQDDSYFKDERDRAAYGYLGNEGDSQRNRVDQLKKIVLYDYWGRFDMDGDKRDENCFVTAIGPRAQRAIRVRRNPYRDGLKPYLGANYIPVTNDFLGVGLMEWCEQLQREINTRYNMGVDNANYILNAMVKVRRAAGIPDAQLKSRPSGRIDCDDPQTDVIPLEMPVIFDKLLAVQQWNDQLWQDITGVGSETAGVRKSAGTAMHRTAGGILALQQAAEARLKMSRLLFEKRSVEPAAEMIISRIKQFMHAPITLDIAGPEGIQYLEVNPHQVNTAEYSLKVVIAPTEQIGRLAEREKWASSLAVMRSLDPQMQLLEWGNILEDWMDATGLPNPQRYLGQMKQKLQLMHQVNILNQMQQPPGMATPMGPNAPQGGKGGGGGQQMSQLKREFSGQKQTSSQKTSGGEGGNRGL